MRLLSLSLLFVLPFFSRILHSTRQIRQRISRNGSRTNVDPSSLDWISFLDTTAVSSIDKGAHKQNWNTLIAVAHLSLVRIFKWRIWTWDYFFLFSCRRTLLVADLRYVSWYLHMFHKLWPIVQGGAGKEGEPCPTCHVTKQGIKRMGIIYSHRNYRGLILQSHFVFALRSHSALASALVCPASLSIHPCSCPCFCYCLGRIT